MIKSKKLIVSETVQIEKIAEIINENVWDFWANSFAKNRNFEYQKIPKHYYKKELKRKI
jgi:tRNA isopentenyl-2-thiomethyl-A-37 hydroxylase MiaE